MASEASKVVDAQKALKQATSEIVQWDNRLEGIKAEYGNLQRKRDMVNAEIEKKMNDYNLYLATKDHELKNRRDAHTQEILALQSDKKEFVEILNKYKAEQAALDAAKSEFAIEKAKVEDTRNRVNQFIISLQRAYTLLG